MLRNEISPGSPLRSGIADLAQAGGLIDAAALEASAPYVGLPGGVSSPLVRPRMRSGLSPRVSRRVREHITAHLNERIENRTLAALAGLSVCHFVRAFKQSHGMPPRQYIMKCRVERVRALLTETDLPLSEIAIASGFADQSHCCRCFRERVGATPGDYRWSTR
jgi:transcriptional regulator GlxA family with amidase domain